MSVSSTLEAKFVFNDGGTEAKITGIINSTNKMDKAMRKMGGRSVAVWNQIGYAIRRVWGYAIQYGKEVIKLNLEMSRQYGYIAVLLDKDVGNSIDSIRRKVKTLAVDLGVAQKDIAEGFRMAITTKIPESIATNEELARKMGRVAKMLRGSTVSAMKLMAVIVKNYNLSLKEALTLPDKLMYTAEKGVIQTFDKLSNSVSRFLGMAKILGLDINDWLAMIASSTSRGLLERISGTGIKAFIKNLGAATKKSKAFAKELGLTLFSEAGIKAKGFPAFLTELYEKGYKQARKAGKGMEFVATLFPSRASKQIVSGLLNDLDAVHKNLKGLDNTIGYSTKKWKIWLSVADAHYLEVQTQRITQGFQELTKAATPALKDISKGFADNLAVLAKWEKNAHGVTKVVAGLLYGWRLFNIVVLTVTSVLDELIGRFTAGKVEFEGWILMAKTTVKEIMKISSLSFTPKFLADPDALWQEMEKRWKNVENVRERAKQNDKEALSDLKNTRKAWDKVLREEYASLDKYATVMETGRWPKFELPVKEDTASEKIKKKHNKYLAGLLEKEEKEKELAEKRKAIAEKNKIIEKEQTSWFSSQYQKQTNSYLKELDTRLAATKKYQDKIKQLDQEQQQAKERYEDRIWGLKMQHLTDEGKRIQQHGIAKTFSIRGGKAFKTGDFKEARRLFDKAQDMYTTMAQELPAPETKKKGLVFSSSAMLGKKGKDTEETRKSVMQRLHWTQKMINKSFGREKQSLQAKHDDTLVKIKQLKGKLLALQKEAKIKLEIMIDAGAAEKALKKVADRINEVQKKFTSKDFVNIKDMQREKQEKQQREKEARKQKNLLSTASLGKKEKVKELDKKHDMMYQYALWKKAKEKKLREQGGVTGREGQKKSDIALLDEIFKEVDEGKKREKQLGKEKKNDMVYQHSLWKKKEEEKTWQNIEQGKGYTMYSGRKRQEKGEARMYFPLLIKAAIEKEKLDAELEVLMKEASALPLEFVEGYAALQKYLEEETAYGWKEWKPKEKKKKEKYWAKEEELMGPPKEEIVSKRSEFDFSLAQEPELIRHGTGDEKRERDKKRKYRLEELSTVIITRDRTKKEKDSLKSFLAWRRKEAEKRERQEAEKKVAEFYRTRNMPSHVLAKERKYSWEKKRLKKKPSLWEQQIREGQKQKAEAAWAQQVQKLSPPQRMQANLPAKPVSFYQQTQEALSQDKSGVTTITIHVKDMVDLQKVLKEIKKEFKPTIEVGHNEHLLERGKAPVASNN